MNQTMSAPNVIQKFNRSIYLLENRANLNFAEASVRLVA